MPNVGPGRQTSPIAHVRLAELASRASLGPGCRQRHAAERFSGDQCFWIIGFREIGTAILQTTYQQAVSARVNRKLVEQVQDDEKR